MGICVNEIQNNDICLFFACRFQIYFIPLHCD
nr:MAG TPA: hypothetical protein [Caudoviricetes sp.]